MRNLYLLGNSSVIVIISAKEPAYALPRDINAAINIKKFALLGKEVEPVDSFSLERGMK